MDISKIQTACDNIRHAEKALGWLINHPPKEKNDITIAVKIHAASSLPGHSEAIVMIEKVISKDGLIEGAISRCNSIISENEEIIKAASR